MQLNWSRNDIHTSNYCTTISWGNKKIRSQGSSEFPTGEETYFSHIIQVSKKHVPPQQIRFHFVEVPNLLTAYNILTIYALVERTHVPTRFVLHSTSFQTHQCRWALQKFYIELQKFQGQQAINHPLHKITNTLCLVRENGTKYKDRFFYSADMDTVSINQMLDICRQQNR